MVRFTLILPFLFMTLPAIVFKQSKALDLKTALFFRHIKAGGIDFRQKGIINPHPVLKKYRHLTSLILKKHVNLYYQQNEKKIALACQKAENEWAAVKSDFFLLTKILFPNHSFSPGKYLCYLSIWNCNPRNLQTKSFQVFYKHKSFKEIIIHEMLHFIFYNYLYKNCPKCKNAKYAKKIWNISEALNIIIQNSTQWRKKLKTQLQNPYPKHKKLIQKMRMVWKKRKNIDSLFKELLPEYKNIKNERGNQSD